VGSEMCIRDSKKGQLLLAANRAGARSLRIDGLVCQLVCRLKVAEADICGTTPRQVTRTVKELTPWCLTLLPARGALQACAISRSATYPGMIPNRQPDLMLATGTRKVGACSRSRWVDYSPRCSIRMTTFPLACPSSRYRIASGTSLNG